MSELSPASSPTPTPRPLSSRPADDAGYRPSWYATWLSVATAVAQRSLCVRSRVGAVIVTASNRIVSTGYNGPPAGFDHGHLECTEWCERARKARDCVPVVFRSDYSDCPSLHAEANALMAADRSTWQGGVIFVTSDVCFSCAKLVANSGLDTVVALSDGAVHRAPEASYRFLERCGLTVYLVHPEGGTA